MKRLHLICNSHIDPVWQWDWNEGIGATLSTFRQAVKFLKEYDFIFCHNEAIIYEWVEKYDPALFKQIQKLVKEGKWVIAGGWYLQPDVNAPSGEALVRQIRLGRKYFKEKFNKIPTTALNYDSFGHSLGLVQILVKTGYDSYLLCRPMKDRMTLKNNHFIWQGPDGSKVKGERADSMHLYTTPDNCAKDVILNDKLKNYAHTDIGVALWGVGNHGGFSSIKDLNDVTDLVNNYKDAEIIHSTPENFFKDIDENQEIVKHSLFNIMPAAYTSMNSIKSKNIELENAIFTTEKFLSSISLMNIDIIDYKERLHNAEVALLKAQFHDIMSGTCCEDGEKTTLDEMNGAISNMNKIKDDCFYYLAEHYHQANKDEFPVFVYNYAPYERNEEIEVEILIPNPVEKLVKEYIPTVKLDGKIIPSQVIKELGNIKMDRRKRIAFIAPLKPSALTRFDITFEVLGYSSRNRFIKEDLIIKDKYKTIKFNSKSGLIDSYIVDGKELLNGNLFEPYIATTNSDPWLFVGDTVAKNIEKIPLSNCKSGLFKGCQNIYKVEDGNVLTQIDSLFETGSSFVKLSYKIYKSLPYIDVIVTSHWNEKEKGLKVKIPSKEDGKFVYQMAFGKDYQNKDGKDYPIHRFAGFEYGNKSLIAFNKNTTGASCIDNDLYLFLFNGAAYCAHYVGDNNDVIEDRNRDVKYIETGRHEHFFRFGLCQTNEVSSMAKDYVEGLYVLNHFPDGKDDYYKDDVLTISDKSVTLEAFYKEDKYYVARLSNVNDNVTKITLSIKGVQKEITFKKFEVKTLYFDGKQIIEKEMFFEI